MRNRVQGLRSCTAHGGRTRPAFGRHDSFDQRQPVAMKKIVVVDYGVGNLRSVAQALRQVAPEADVRISGEVADIQAADRIVLPGQGAMPDCMRSLRDSGVQDAVLEAARSKP